MSGNNVIIITGVKGEGKTTKLKSIIEILKLEKLPLLGFTAQANCKDGDRDSYSLVDICTEIPVLLCTAKEEPNYIKYGSFYFNPSAISYGQKLLIDKGGTKKIVVIDEIGPFELVNQVWHSSLYHQLNNTNNLIILTIRTKIIKDVIRKYNISRYSVYNINDQDHEITLKIKEYFEGQNIS